MIMNDLQLRELFERFYPDEEVARRFRKTGPKTFEFSAPELVGEITNPARFGSVPDNAFFALDRHRQWLEFSMTDGVLKISLK